MVDKAVLIIGVIIIALLVVIAALILTGKPSPSTSIATTTLSQLQTLPTTTITVTTTIPPTPANASVMALFINKSQASTLIGAGGTYGAYSRAITPDLAASLPPQISSLNLTAEYNMTYNITTKTSDSVLSEVIFPTKYSAAFYSYVLTEYPYFNTTLLLSQGAIPINSITNATLPGFTYSTSVFELVSNNLTAGGNATNATLTFDILAGRSSNNLVLVSIFRANTSSVINNTQLALYTSQHLN